MIIQSGESHTSDLLTSLKGKRPAVCWPEFCFEGVVGRAVLVSVDKDQRILLIYIDLFTLESNIAGFFVMLRKLLLVRFFLEVLVLLRVFSIF